MSDVLLEALIEVGLDLVGAHAGDDDLVDEGERDLAVGAYSNRFTKLRLAPDRDLEDVAIADFIFGADGGSGRGSVCGGRVRRDRGATLRGTYFGTGEQDADQEKNAAKHERHRSSS